MKIFLSLFCTLVLSHSTSAQTASLSGREFQLCFDKNYRNDDRVDASAESMLQLSIVMSADKDATVELSIPAISFKKSVQLLANKSESVIIPATAQMEKTGVNAKSSLHITATQPISVVCMSHRSQTSDSYAAIPVDRLGADYRLACFARLSEDLIAQACVVATEDNTTVDIIPTQACVGGLGVGSIKSVSLQAGDVYRLQAASNTQESGDLSGTTIRSNKNVAVISGHSGAYVPRGVQSCNVLVEQLRPVRDWGMTYYSQPIPHRKHYSLKVVAASDGTEIRYKWSDGEMTQTMKDGEVKDISSITGPMVITSTKPIQCVQYSHGGKDVDGIGDPCMILLRPMERFVKDVTVLLPAVEDADLAIFPVPTTTSTAIVPVSKTTQGASGWKHFAMLTVATHALATLRFDGKPVDTSSFRPIDPQFSVGSILLNTEDSGKHITCDVPFSLLQSGVQAYDAYGHGW